MGRKSNRSKEKKQKRKEEMEKVKANQIVVDKANSLEDPMAILAPFKKYERNGLSVSISCVRAPAMQDDLFEWCFKLVRDNMQTLYEQSDWGWEDEQKKAEMREEAAWYLIAHDNQDNSPVACVHFRFDMDNDDQVVYCYEVQLIKSYRRKGLGKFLMQILELLAHKNGMCKVMLTAFKHNQAAQDFFMKKLMYEVDETNPEDSIVDLVFGEEEAFCYQILSKQIGQKA